MYITILSLFFVRFLLYVVYVFALCSPYLEDNKVSIYLLLYTTLLPDFYPVSLLQFSYKQSEKLWILIRWLHQKPADLDLKCFTKGIKPGSISKTILREIKT